MITKSFRGVTVKDADAGIVEAVFSTFGVVDLDGDVTYKESFTPGAAVIISAYGHTSWDGAPPLGKGTIRTTDTEAVADLQFLMETDHGRQAFLTVKGMAELQEWSYSLHDVVSEPVEVDGRKARGLRSIRVHEVSPVLMGASIDTRTMSAKTARGGSKQTAGQVASMLRDAGRERWADDDTWVWLADWDVDDAWAVFEVEPNGEAARLVRVEFTRTDTSVSLADDETDVERSVTFVPKSSKFSEQFDIALRGVKQLAEMTRLRLSERAESGKSIDEQTDAHGRLVDELGLLKAAIDAATQRTPDEARVFARAIAHLQGVALS